MKYDVIIAGTGMGGIGAALHFAQRTNFNVLLIEKQQEIGGTAIMGGVNCFEPGVSQNSFLREIISELQKSGEGRVQKTVRDPDSDLRCGISADAPDSEYDDTLKRGGNPPGKFRRFMFEPKAMIRIIRKMLNKSNIHILTGCELVGVEVCDRKIKSVKVKTQQGTQFFEADYFIDATGDVVLSRLAGCCCWIGAESREVYNEISAPKNEEFKVNGVSYMFRLSRKCEKDCLLDNGVNVDAWLDEKKGGADVLTQLNYYPNGDISVNMLPTMTGEEYFSMPEEKADAICLKRVLKYWEYLRENPVLKLGEKGYRLAYVFPLRGIRESHRLIGKYVLTQNDIITPISDHHLKHEFIAYADHPMDTHGETSELTVVQRPYGIPYGCLLTNEIDNMLVACRGASFSHLAASSCRLSRTMLRLGEVAAIACQRSFETGTKLKDLDASKFGACEVCN